MHVRPFLIYLLEMQAERFGSMAFNLTADLQRIVVDSSRSALCHFVGLHMIAAEDHLLRLDSSLSLDLSCPRIKF